MILSVVLQLCNILRNSVAPLVISQFKTQYSFLLNTGEEIFTWLSDISYSHMKKHPFLTESSVFEIRSKNQHFSFFFPPPPLFKFYNAFKVWNEILFFILK